MFIYVLVNADIPTFVQSLMLKAVNGDAEAMYTIGYCYDVGKAVKLDTLKAVYWYKSAARQGYSSAYNNLGVMYSTGHNGRLPKEEGHALLWFRNGAKLNDMDCQFHSGLLLLRQRIYDESLEYFIQSGDQGMIFAQVNVGALYFDGKGTEINYAKAINWFKKAALHGDALALHNLGVIFLFGKGIKVDQEKSKAYFRLALSGKNAGLIPQNLSKRKRKKGGMIYYQA